MAVGFDLGPLVELLNRSFSSLRLVIFVLMSVFTK